MPRHGENIFKRKDGRWEGRYIFSYNENGKAKYKSVYGKSYSVVKQKLNIAKSSNVIIKKSDYINTFGDLLDYWLECNRGKNKITTQNKYEFLIEKHIRPQLGNVKLNRISSKTVNEFIENKNENLSNSYVRTMAIIIKSALELGIKERYQARNRLHLKNIFWIISILQHSEYIFLFMPDSVSARYVRCVGMTLILKTV